MKFSMERPYLWLFAILALVGLAADQASKYVVFARLYPAEAYVTLNGARQVVGLSFTVLGAVLRYGLLDLGWSGRDGLWLFLLLAEDGDGFLIDDRRGFGCGRRGRRAGLIRGENVLIGRLIGGQRDGAGDLDADGAAGG